MAGYGGALLGREIGFDTSTVPRERQPSSGRLIIDSTSDDVSCAELEYTLKYSLIIRTELVCNDSSSSVRSLMLG